MNCTDLEICRNLKKHMFESVDLFMILCDLHEAQFCLALSSVLSSVLSPVPVLCSVPVVSCPMLSCAVLFRLFLSCLLSCPVLVSPVSCAVALRYHNLITSNPAKYHSTVIW